MKRGIESISKNNIVFKKVKIIDSDFQKKVIIRNDNYDLFVKTDLQRSHVKIGKYVYNNMPNDLVDDYDEWINMNKTVNITLTQFNQISDYIANEIVAVSEFDSSTVNVVSKIVIKIYTNNSIKLTFKKSDLTDLFINFLSNSIISVKQKFTVNYQNYELSIFVNEMDNMEIGKISKNTNIEFKFSKNISIYQNLVTIGSNHLDVRISSCTDLNTKLRLNNEITKYDVKENTELDNLIYSVNGKFPLFIHRKIIDFFIKDRLKLEFLSGSTITFVKNDFEFRIIPTVFNSNNEARYPNNYILESDNILDNILDIQSETEDVIIVDDLKIVENISFDLSIKAINGSQIIFADEIKTFIRKNIKTFTTDQIFALRYLSKDIIFKINYVSPFIGKNILYKINDETNITIDSLTNLVMVLNKDMIEIKTITLKISKQAKLSLIRARNKDKIYNFSEELLKNIIQNKLPNLVAKKYRTSVTYDNTNFDLNVVDIEFETETISDKSPETINESVQTHGQITNKTKFKFIISKKLKGSTIHKSTISSQIMDDPLTELEKYIGGLSTELKLVVKNICLPRGNLREEFLLRGLKPTKGIILHGPPGTGKTHLASQLGKIIGSNVTLMSGSEVFGKWVGQSESNVRKIFKEAKNSWKKLGKMSPTYMVIIDEIDAMLPVRSSGSSNSVRESVVNQFLSEMDGLVQFNNFICIGITNRLELLDPAAIRSGRFDLHVKIDIPDKDGRKRIFEIHTKKLAEINRLGKIDVDKIVILMDKFTGADIQNVVESASINSLERLSDLKSKNKEISESDYSIPMSDFIQAIDKVKEINSKNDLNKILSMYN